MDKEPEKSEVDVISGVFGDILRLYGISVPQLSVLVGVVFGSLGFNEYFNPGAWTIASILSFALVYLFRRQISRRLIRAALFSLCVLFLFIAAPAFFFHYRNIESGTFIKRYSPLTSAYFAAAITIPLAVTIASYRKQEECGGLLYPSVLDRAIRERLLAAPFYKKDVLYDVEIAPQDESQGVRLSVTHSYTVVNRTKENHVWTAIADTIGPHMEVVEWRIGKQQIHINDRRYHTSHGAEVAWEVPRQSEEHFEFRINVDAGPWGTEMLATYTIATDMEIRVANRVQDTDITFVSHHEQSHLIHPVMDGDLHRIRLDGLLPYQGVLLKWFPRSQKGNIGS